MPESLAKPVSRSQFHRLQNRFSNRRFRAHAIILQVSVPILIDQNTAFTTATLGQENTRTRQTGRVVLDKLHILQGNARTVGHGHAISSLDRTVGREREYLATTTGGHDDH